MQFLQPECECPAAACFADGHRDWFDSADRWPAIKMTPVIAAQLTIASPPVRHVHLDGTRREAKM